MHILDRLLPPTIFGREMPWAEHEKPIETEKPVAAQEPEEELQEPLAEGPSAPAIEPSTSIEDGLAKLKLEQFTDVEKRAGDLHEKSKAVHVKIEAIDELLTLIQQWCTEHPNKPIDCKDPAILKATQSLRNQGIRVPLPEGKLETHQVANVFTVMGNQRSLLADELKEHSSEFQQCTVERNTLLQHLTSMLSELSRSKNKISTNLSARH